MFRGLSIGEVREISKSNLETLEKWLRRLIDQQLSPDYGNNYMFYETNPGQFLIKTTVRNNIIKRRNEEPERYPRNVDAILLDDVIDIVLHPSLYSKYFREPLLDAFPAGTEMARKLLERLVEHRNRLSHANPISLRHAEQIVCYVHDITDSIQKYYKKRGEDRVYNVPTIIEVSDSLGNVFYDNEINNHRNSTGRCHFDIREKNAGSLRPGDTLKIEIKVDPIFTDFNIHWVYTSNNPAPTIFSTLCFELNIGEEHVREDFAVYVTIVSNKSWHRLGDSDDQLGLTYRILPPIE